MTPPPNETVLILDFGSQYTQLITRRIRELKVYSEIKPYDVSLQQIHKMSPKGIILSGGPASVYDVNAPLPDPGIFELGVPVLGICYGLQVIARLFSGGVANVDRREYGLARLEVVNEDRLLAGVRQTSNVWMSHGDALTQIPDGFETLGVTDNSPFASVMHARRKIYGVQFHPEVSHTEEGRKILANFLFDVCHCRPDWTPQAFIQRTVESVRELARDARAICALSGGVDSVVAAALVKKALGDRLTCVFVDTGLMRKNEALQVTQTFEKYFGSNFIPVEASSSFLTALSGVSDPEQKRKLIGAAFIDVFEAEAQKIEGVGFLVQGTLYPDVIESVSTNGPSQTIKTHHNVGGLPDRMNLTLIEPLRELFKDEVREVGAELGIPGDILGRHPFPGPGLAVRILGEITEERLGILREADWIYIEELKRAKLYDKIWQAFAVLLPVKTVGVMGDQRTYEHVIALRAVTSRDGMTADWSRISYDVLALISNRIINEIRGVNRVVYDISSKPPGTIEWE